MDGGGPVAHAQTGKPSMKGFQGSPIYFFCPLHLCFILGGKWASWTNFNF